MRASKLGRTRLVRLLAEYGAELDATAKFNLSALMPAVINGHTDIVRTLIEAGSDLGIRGGKAAAGFSGKTALAPAHHAESTSIIKLLGGAGAPE